MAQSKSERLLHCRFTHHKRGTARLAEIISLTLRHTSNNVRHPYAIACMIWLAKRVCNNLRALGTNVTFV